MAQAKDIRVEMKFRNNLVLSRMEAQGISTVAELCRRLKKFKGTEPHLKPHQSNLGELINMKRPALRANGEWDAYALLLSAFFKCMPEDLFSEPQRQTALEKNRAHAEVAYEEIRQLGQSKGSTRPDVALEAKELRVAIAAVLGTLTAQEQTVLRMSFGFDDGEEKTFDQIGQAIGLSGSRAQMILATALRKVKYSPSRMRVLRGAVDLDEGPWGPRSTTDEDVIEALIEA